MPLPLTELFPEEDYLFHLTLRKGNLTDFFREPDPEALAERRRGLDTDPSRYAAMAEAAEPLLSETESWVASWSPSLSIPSSATTDQRLRSLGRALAPDFMLLSRDPDGTFRLQAAVVCFPSSWVPAEKIGLSLDDIHQIVPRLNATLGATISQFLTRLRPGTAYERANWGLAATPERNMHPALHRPRLGLPVDPSRIWLRIEDQILAALPVTGGILFGIRLRVIPLPAILADPQLKSGFLRALATMPKDLAEYKGLSAIQPEISWAGL
jgi:hypothetical protein